MMLMAGEARQWVAHQLGHRDPSFTVQTYARRVPTDTPEAGSRAVDRREDSEKMLTKRKHADTKADERIVSVGM